MSKQYISELKDKDTIKSIFLVGDKQLLKDKKGNDYLNMYLSDKSGALNARMWDKVDLISSGFQSGDFVEVKGHVQVYQNKRQIVVHDLKRVENEGIDLADFLPVSATNPKENLATVKTYISEIGDANVRSLLESFFADSDVEQTVLKTPAARSIHHAYVGGLLEHVVSICKIMYFLGDHYRFLDRDLLIFGAIFHDIGKVRELSVDNGINYTNEGRLVGHMGIALEFIDREADKIDGFPQELKDVLKHIVLSHHGKLEFGSPKRPKFLEALIVSMVDELDSRVDSFKSIMESELESGSEWTGYISQYDRYFYLEILRRKLSENS